MKQVISYNIFVFTIFAIEYSLKFLVMEIDIWLLLDVWNKSFLSSIILLTNSETSEIHNILGESTSFITKNVLNLSEFLIEITWLGSHFMISGYIVHLEVPT